MALVCKVCGLTRAEDVAVCHEAGVDFIGFIFVPGSPRCVSPEQVAGMPAGPARKVGVFAGWSRDEMLRAASLAGLDFLQLHGGESPELCRELGAGRVIKTLWPEALAEKTPGPEALRPETLQKDALPEECRRFADACAFFLLDAGKKGGGSGRCLDPRWIAGPALPRPRLLAGGLSARTLPDVLPLCSPSDGLDLNSGLELRPGIKDPRRIREAVRLIKNFDSAPTALFAASRPGSPVTPKPGSLP